MPNRHGLARELDVSPGSPVIFDLEEETTPDQMCALATGDTISYVVRLPERVARYRASRFDRSGQKDTTGVFGPGRRTNVKKLTEVSSITLNPDVESILMPAGGRDTAIVVNSNVPFRASTETSWLNVAGTNQSSYPAGSGIAVTISYGGTIPYVGPDLRIGTVRLESLSSDPADSPIIQEINVIQYIDTIRAEFELTLEPDVVCRPDTDVRLNFTWSGIAEFHDVFEVFVDGVSVDDYILSPSVTTDYTITVSPRDFNDEKSEVITIVVDAPSATIEVEDSITCAGEQDGALTVHPVGGMPSYEVLWSTNSTDSVITDLGAGTFTVTITDTRGCTTLDTFTLQEPDPLILADTLIVGSPDDTSGGSITLEITGGIEPYTFNWYLDDSLFQTSVDPVLSDLPHTANYSVTVTDVNGCVLEIGPITIPRISTVSTLHVTGVSSFEVFPSPASNLLNYRYALRHAEETTLSLWTLNGQLLQNVKHQASTANSGVMMIQALPAGTYFLKLLTPKGAIIKRFVKI